MEHSKKRKPICMAFFKFVAISVLVIATILGFKLLLYAYWMQDLTHRAIDKPCEPSPRSDQGHPKVIHQIFYNSQSIPAIPPAWSAAVLSCKYKHPDYKFILWTEEMVETLLTDKYPWFLETYHNYMYQIQRIDVARLFILHTHGGVYMDMDEVCLDSWDQILRKREECDVVLVATTPWGVSNGIFLARPRDPFVWHVIASLNGTDRIWYVAKHATVMLSTGPTMVSDRMLSYEGKTHLKVLSLEERARLFRNLRAGSWHGSDEVIVSLVTDKYIAFLLLLSAGIVIIVCQNGKKKCLPYSSEKQSVKRIGL